MRGEGNFEEAPVELDAVIVGAGFAGLYMLHRLRSLGLSARVLEAGSGIGGTWFWNRYPGARCDVESMDYSYSFSPALEQEWSWTERYPAQPEILAYLEHVVDRFELRRDIQLATRVVCADFDEASDRWLVRTDRGERFSAQFCVMATGCLSRPRVPDFPGRDSFAGATYHTADWPRAGVDFTGQRVAVIGAGSSGIQVIPKIAEQAARLLVFQRTPNFSVPAHNGPIDPEHARRVKASYPERRELARSTPAGMPAVCGTTSALAATPEERARVYEECWRLGGFSLLYTYADLMIDPRANATVAEFVRGKIREQVRDPAVAELLCPKDHPLGARRICVDSGYYATYNRPNVTLVDVRRAPIEAITPQAIRTREGEYAVDSIVFATGFDAMTGALDRIAIRGREGRTLREAWASGPRTYLGLGVAGFPNLFTVTGPGSPSVLSNMLTSIEQHVGWISDCVAFLRARGLRRIEATRAAEAAWVEHVREVAAMTLYPQAESWYLGANVPGKPRVFMPYAGGVDVYRQKCDEVAARGYEGFALSGETSLRAAGRAG